MLAKKRKVILLEVSGEAKEIHDLIIVENEAFEDVDDNTEFNDDMIVEHL